MPVRHGASPEGPQALTERTLALVPRAKYPHCSARARDGRISLPPLPSLTHPLPAADGSRSVRRPQTVAPVKDPADAPPQRASGVPPEDQTISSLRLARLTRVPPFSRIARGRRKIERVQARRPACFAQSKRGALVTTLMSPEKTVDAPLISAKVKISHERKHDSHLGAGTGVGPCAIFARQKWLPRFIAASLGKPRLPCCMDARHRRRRVHDRKMVRCPRISPAFASPINSRLKTWAGRATSSGQDPAIVASPASFCSFR